MPNSGIQRGTQEAMLTFLMARMTSPTDEAAMAETNTSLDQLQKWRERSVEFQEMHDKVAWTNVEAARLNMKERLGEIIEEMFTVAMKATDLKAKMKAIELWLRATGMLESAAKTPGTPVKAIQGDFVVNVITNAPRPYELGEVVDTTVKELSSGN